MPSIIDVYSICAIVNNCFSYLDLSILISIAYVNTITFYSHKKLKLVTNKNTYTNLGGLMISTQLCFYM